MSRSDRGNQITIMHHMVNQYKREYIRKDYNKEQLGRIKSSLEDRTPNDSIRSRENDARIKAINSLLNNEQ